MQRENLGAAGFGETDGFHARIPNYLFLLNKRVKVVFEKQGGGPLADDTLTWLAERWARRRAVQCRLGPQARA
jgi:hypothetical protein